MSVRIINGKVYKNGTFSEEELVLKEGKIISAEDGNVDEIYDAKGNYVFPGIIDCHAHLNEPGFEYREDFETGSRAAVVAGCTTLIDMPLNNDPSLMNKEIFDLKLGKISKHSLRSEEHTSELQSP